MKVLFLTPYPLGQAPSQRFRFEQYLDQLESNGISYKVEPFLNDSMWNRVYKKGDWQMKIVAILGGLIDRFFLLFSVGKYDKVFIHREAAFIGPPFFEWVISKVFGKQVIYDFDDAIWLPNVSESNRAISNLKWYGKVSSICHWAWKVSTGNQYLADYAKGKNGNVVLNPTTIDTVKLHNKTKEHKDGRVVIGWTGTHTTMHHLDIVVPVIEQLEKEIDMEFLVISNEPPKFQLESLKYVEWSAASEIEDLLRMDIGIMPMFNNEWTRGKCGFKILQYLALGIPAVASPVGVNSEMVTAQTGKLCNSTAEWVAALKELAASSAERQKLGQAGRALVEHKYSVRSNASNFMRLFQ